ncbi:MAG: hypothetical protein DI576_14230 [Actinomyces sp.]|nr:MAG: hypothetical protein DI576_14230 [Actinomyces sp.]
MMDLPTALRAGLCILQLVLVLALARFPLERAGGHDGLRLARDAAVGVSLLPVPVLGPALGAATLIALVVLRRRADDGARAALSRLASSALLPGRTAWWGRDDKASDRRVRSTLSARPPVQSLPERPKATGLASSPPLSRPNGRRPACQASPHLIKAFAIARLLPRRSAARKPA